MNDLDFARPDQQEESEFGTNLDQLRTNLALTPKERLDKYLRRNDEWRRIIRGAAEWRSSQYSNGSKVPEQDTS